MITTQDINGKEWSMYDCGGYLVAHNVQVELLPCPLDYCECVRIGDHEHRLDDFAVVSTDRLEHASGWYLTK